MVKNMNNITAITVVHNTPELLIRAVTSIKRFYPELQILIINASNEDSECTHILNSIQDDYITLVNVGYNIGHGKGMHLGLTTITTDYALIFDSDIYMKNGNIIEPMLRALDYKYGVGEIVKTNDEGYNDAKGEINYLHPYFMLLDVAQYFKHPPFVHHGAPCYKAMNEINKSGCGQMLVNYDLSDYIRHDGRGTRNIFSAEYKLNWE
jgi:glycosyltransferase involved in cell wall biosynthesis